MKPKIKETKLLCKNWNGKKMQEEKNQFQNWLIFFFDVLINLTQLNSIKETDRKSVIYQKLSKKEKLFYLQILHFPRNWGLKNSFINSMYKFYFTD